MTLPAVIFLGPTMPVSEARQLLDAVFLPPVRQGDVYRAFKAFRPAIIGIVDGYFHQVPSVWHREILWALTEGVHVFGAASMGALRAAELHVFGMCGIGKVFEAYRDGRYAPFPECFEDDDEVAVIHGPPETGFVAVSEALVDIRSNLARAAEAGIVRADLRDDLVAIGKAMPYRERSIMRILDAASAQGTPAAATERLVTWLASHRVSQKRLDAAVLLGEIRDRLASSQRQFEPSFRFEPASVWQRFIGMAEMAEAPSEVEAVALEELRLIPTEWRAARREAALRHAAIETAKDLDLSPSDRAVRASLDRVRRAAGLLTRESLVAWMVENALDEGDMTCLIRDEALLDLLELRICRDLERVAADHLRLRGRFATLAARGLAKRRWLANARLARRRLSSLEAAALVDWFIENRLAERLETPQSADKLATDLGFPNTEAFLEALWLEQAYSFAEASATPDPAAGPP